MDIKVYIITNPQLVECLQNDDLSAFQRQIEEDEYLDFGEPQYFNTTQDALAFCAGIGYGKDDHGSVERYPLRSFEECDRPFIELIENH